jgi:3-hydroxybutyryl-CoA dehydrogenase
MHIGIAGAGTMGSGIALAFAQADGFDVVLTDIKDEFAANGKQRIAVKLDKLVEKTKITREQADAILARIKTGTREALAPCDLVVEAALENMATKRELFQTLQTICGKDAIFATNTSSLSITEMGQGLDRPVVGMHFFNPADMMKLVEVIAGVDTPVGMIARVKDIATAMGKTPVEVKEGAGFVVNRILIPMINEAIGILAEGAASAEDIDTAMQLGANHPMGPLALGDLVGLDVCLAIMEVLHTEMGEDKYRPHPLLRKMVRGGRLGRKTGRGFFDYGK